MKNEIVQILENRGINGFNYPGGTDKASDHSYDTYYSDVLKPYQDNKVRLLEIGVQFGGSSLLWYDFLPQSNLVLVDIRNQVHQNIFNSMNSDRYSFHEMDAFSKENVNSLKTLYPEGFDIIIEDGPHTVNSQVFAIKNYTPLLKEGGILIIEDIQKYDDCKLIMESIGDIPHKSCELIDLRHIRNRYDDLLIVVKK